MSFFADDRANEMRDLFFETATELLQALNEEGLQLEQRPGDSEVVRQVRRTVHTLKGDSAAVGFTELSALAHELEDALTPELAQKHGARVADMVLAAADSFASMLTAYRSNAAPPNGDSVREVIHELLGKGAAVEAAATPKAVLGKFQWTEYEQMVIGDAASRGLKILEVALAVDPNCIIRAAAVQMAKNALSDCGTILAVVPDETTPADKVTVIEAAVATSFDQDYVAKKGKIPAVISEVLVRKYEGAAQPAIPRAEQPQEEDVLELDTPLPLQQTAAAAAATIGASTQLGPESTLRVDAERIDNVMNLVGELIIGKSMLTQTINEFEKAYSKDPLRNKFLDALAFQQRVLNDLQKSVMKIRMVPVEQLFRRYPRMVRDVAKACDKEVGLVVTGQDTDLDKSILDVLAEPLAHLVRNAIGHGIESPIDRMAAGKLKQGTVKLNAYHQGNTVVIEVSDDGRGIDPDVIMAKAIEKGVIKQEDAIRMTEQEALQLIFAPGFSTAEEVTEVSGRGVGMDVVKTVIDRLKGTVHIETSPHEGTTFYLRVPLTLAIIKALLFRVSDKLYAVPLGSVLEITRANADEIHRVDQHEVIRLRDQVLPLVRLSKLAGSTNGAMKKMFIIVITIGERKFGLIVDKLVGEDELVIKALDDHLVATDYVSGASILGDGTVVLILNINAVVARLGRIDQQTQSKIDRMMAQGATA